MKNPYEEMYYSSFAVITIKYSRTEQVIASNRIILYSHVHLFDHQI